MTDDTTLPFWFPAIRGKKLTAAFDGGRLSSDGGVMLLAEAARQMRIAEKLAAVIPDRRDPKRVVHPLSEILLARILAIACGYEDADDLDALRADPVFKLACGRLPESGTDLMSQPTVSRWENAPGLRDLVRLGRVMVDLYCASYATPPEAVVLDIDDTVDVVHGHQQLSLFNAHYDERCFLPIHVYDTATGRPVAMILRPGKTPSGVEVRGHLRRLVRRIRYHWSTTKITIRGDGHYCRPEVMDWCEANGVDYVFGLTGTKALAAKVEAAGPAWVAFLGIGAYRVAYDHPGALVGPRPDPVAGARVWVLPNPSGLNAHYQLPGLAAAFAALRSAAAGTPTSARPGSRSGGPA